jgi:tetratricopeptide (TPR) repeat protein
MYSKMRWLKKLSIPAVAVCVIVPAASAQTRVLRIQSLVAPDEAREIFNAGQRFFDEYRFAEAETKFRDVIRRFPKNPIADRADYYLIRTLVQVGKKNEALSRIDAFARQYPKSPWIDDVQELRIQLTNQVPPRAEAILLRTVAPAPPSPEAPFRPRVHINAPAVPPSPAPLPVPALSLQNADPEISLQQEIMRAIFRSNFDRALEIASERLKANPADPVVLSSLNVVASSSSAQATSMLVGLVKNSPNPKARRDAIFWLGLSRGDKDMVVDTLLGLLPSLSDDDSDAIAYSLSQIGTDKAFNALAGIARDKSKSERVRNNALFWIVQSRAGNRVSLLEDIYKNSMDNAKIRQQVMFALNQTHEPQAVPVMANAAMNDPEIEVRKQAVFWLERSPSPEARQALERLLQRK